MKFRWYLLLLIVFLLSSCDFSYSKKLKGIDYSVGWVVMPELTSLYYDIPGSDNEYAITEGRITDVYWNKQYILAKQCQLDNDSLVGYYIVKLLSEGTKRGVPCDIIGPLSEEKYKEAKQALHLDEQNMKYINIFKKRFLFW